MRAERGPDGICWTCGSQAGTPQTFTGWSSLPQWLRTALATVPSPLREQVEAALRRGRVPVPLRRAEVPPAEKAAEAVEQKEKAADQEPDSDRWLEME